MPQSAVPANEETKPEKEKVRSVAQMVREYAEDWRDPLPSETDDDLIDMDRIFLASVPDDIARLLRMRSTRYPGDIRASSISVKWVESILLARLLKKLNDTP